MPRIKVLEMIDKTFLGGGQIHILSLAKCLNRNKFEVSVCSNKQGPLVDELKKNYIKHFPVSFQKNPHPKIIQKIRDVLDSQFDILHTHGGVAGFWGRLAARKSSVPVVIHTLHGIHYLHYRNFILKHLSVYLERWLSRHTDAVIFVSDSDKKKGEDYRLAPKEKMVVIKNGVDFSSFPQNLEQKPKHDLRKQLGIEPHQPVVGTVARLHRQKGIVYLLQAATRIYPHFSQVKILLVGGGPLRRKLERLSQKWGLENYVLFLGERKDTPSLLALMDVFVLPSLWEGMPYVIMEAGALGRPVVATAVDGVKELIQNGKEGLLVPPGDAKSLSTALIQLIKKRDYGTQLGKNIQRKIRQEYDQTQMVKEVERVYLRLSRGVNADK